MNPSSLQSPRLPLVAAALGPRMMLHAARFADGWNTMSFSPDFDAQLAELSERNARMDEMCADLGREPEGLRRCVNLFDADARAAGGRLRYYYDDEDLLVHLVTSLKDAGYTEFGLYYPTVPSQRDAFEHIARGLIPSLR